MTWKIGDKITVDPQDTDLALIEQGGITRNSTFLKIKNFLLGTATLTTTDKTVKGAMNEINTGLSKRMRDIVSITSAIQGKKIKIIGDSITAGVGGTGYATDGEIIYDANKVNLSGYCWANIVKSHLETNYGCTVKNYGVSGINSWHIVNYMTDFIKSDDDIIIVMIGTNNRNTDLGITALENDIKTIYNYVKSLNKEIIFISPPEVSPDDEATRLHKMYEVENAILKATTDLGIEYISMYHLYNFYLNTKKIELTEVLYDLVHPNDRGYEILTYLILNKLGIAYNVKESNNAKTLPLSRGVASSGFTPMFSKEENQINITGRITNTTSADIINNVLFVLPLGYRPSKQISVMIPISYVGTAWGTIYTNGECKIIAVSQEVVASHWLSVDTIKFYI